MEILLEKQHERCRKLRETNTNSEIFTFPALYNSKYCSPDASVENALSYASMALEDFKRFVK